MEDWLDTDLVAKIEQQYVLELMEQKQVVQRVYDVINKYKNDNTLDDATYDIVNSIMDELIEAIKNV